MNKNEIINKIFEDRKNMSDDMMLYYDEEDCFKTFRMSVEEVLKTVPKEFNIVITGEVIDDLELTTWGDFEKVYYTFKITEKLKSLNIKYEDTEEILYVDSLSMKIIKDNYCDEYVKLVFDEMGK